MDTNIWIYALEGYSEFLQLVTDLFSAIDRGEVQAITSELTLAEVLVKPFMDGSQERQTAYRQAIHSSQSLQVVPVSREILIRAAELRANSPIKLPDAIHMATARSQQCSVFLTNDQRLPTIANLNILLLSDIT